MKISKILEGDKPSISFEVFPPKRQNSTLLGREAERAAMERTKDVVRKIAAVKPSFISVTYGAAGGSTGANTSTIADFVQRECGVPVLAHLTCLTSSREKIADEIKDLRAKGVENILCLRGDYPPDARPAALEASGMLTFFHAVDLVRALRPSSFCLGGACYPEKHPESDTLAQDIENLKVKVDAGLDFLTTQMFFDNNTFFHYLARLRRVGITIPIVPGIMPVANSKQISRICKLSGTVLPPRFISIVDRFGRDPESMLDAGIAYATEQIVDLFANGIDHVHVYTMNRPEIASRIMSNLHGILA